MATASKKHSGQAPIMSVGEALASSFEDMRPTSAPFPVLPSAILIASLVASAYPHLDMEGDKIVSRFGLPALNKSTEFMTAGSCFLLLGYYLAQFVSALAPLSGEYLGSYATAQACLLGVVLTRAIVFPATLAFDIYHVVYPVLAASAACVITYDTAARMGTHPHAAYFLAAGTHVGWLLFTLGYCAVCVQSFLRGELPSAHRLVAALLCLVCFVVRLVSLVFLRKQREEWAEKVREARRIAAELKKECEGKND